MNQVQESFSPKLITSATGTNVIKSQEGSFGGIFVSSIGGTPTIKVYDNTAASGTVLLDTFIPVAATFYRGPAGFATGLTVVLTVASGTTSCTVFWT